MTEPTDGGHTHAGRADSWPAQVELEPGGPVEWWLDEVFDRLTGTGAGGRRALAELDDHLRTAVADGVARGLARVDAEREAVARFGRPGHVARGIRAAHRGVLRPVLLGGWMLGGAAVVALGLSVTLTAVLQMFFEDGVVGGRCVHIMADSPGLCGDLPGSRRLGYAGLAVLGVGLMALVALHLARRFTPMRGPAWVPRRRILVRTGALAAIAGVAILGNPTNAFGMPQFRLYSVAIPMACATAATLLGLGTALWLVRLRPELTDPASGSAGRTG